MIDTTALLLLVAASLIIGFFLGRILAYRLHRPPNYKMVHAQAAAETRRVLEELDRRFPVFGRLERTSGADGEQCGWRKTSSDTVFASPFGTIRACRHCGVLVSGGPTACVSCAEKHSAVPR